MEKIFAELGVRLTEMAVKGTASIVQKKIKASKDEQNIIALRQNYEEIINELISEREEAILIAQAYKNELEKVVISDDDIEHLHYTVKNFVSLLSFFGKPNMIDHQTLLTLQSLISVNTLKAMQLLGFNYKAAIGEPLTQLCAQKITSLGNIKTSDKKKK